ncbi:hypothetical protein ACOI1C_21685 [Bacillus sp. DJP31]|uniref:hypothetical protein n=1 Tax=Bacillus sp. DJP31 TaxID=3409789 RepID=UPI003BB75F7B
MGIVQKLFNQKIHEASYDIFDMLSRFIGVNTFCVSKTDASSSQVFSVFNRGEILFERGAFLDLDDAF